MDPDKCYEAMRDLSLSLEDRKQSARNLAKWLNSGGFLPSQATTRASVRRQIWSVLNAKEIFNG